MVNRIKTKLPKYVHCYRTRHGKLIYYYCPPGAERKVRLPDFSHPDFKQAVIAAQTSKPTPLDRDGTRGGFDRTNKSRVGKTLVAAVRAARTRSRKRGTEFDLSTDWALDLAETQGFRCALTGIPFYATNKATSKVNPFTPSFDRIDCSKGYTKDNVRLVVWAINAMLLDWGEDTFKKVATRYRVWQGQKRPSMVLLDKEESYPPNTADKSTTYDGDNGVWCGREKSHNS